jgi:hypothetical protein
MFQRGGQPASIPLQRSDLNERSIFSSEPERLLLGPASSRRIPDSNLARVMRHACFSSGS